MNVIVSSELQDNFSNFVVVDTFRKVRDILNTVTVLILHKFKESEFDVGCFIQEFYKAGNIKTFMYISDTPLSTVQTVLKGVNGIYVQDEFYLEDEEELNDLLNELTGKDKETTDLSTPALNVVNEFIEAFSRGEDRINTPLYLDQVKSAITTLTEVTKEQENKLTTMGSSTLGVFEQATNIIKKLNSQRQLVEKKINELEYNMANSSSKPSFGNNVMFFSPVKYLKNSKVLLIREYSPCRFLTSFCLGYLNHLHYELNKRCKLIFVHQKGHGVALKYSDFVSITQESAKMMSLYDADIVATNNPKKEVMNELLGKHDDVIIVVDRLYAKDDIVTGRVERVNAVGSRSDIKRYGLKPENTIFTITGAPKMLFTIPIIKEYPLEVDARKTYYSQAMGKQYTILDKRLGLV